MKRFLKVCLMILLFAGVGFAGWYYGLRTDPAQIEYYSAAVARGTVKNTISSSGQVEAMVTLEVGSQVTGLITQVYADFNSRVTAGQRLALLDPRELEAQVRNAEANLRSAQSRILTAEADRRNADISLASAEASMESAELDLKQAELNYQRAETLFAQGLVPKTEMENVEIQLQSAQARIISQKSSLQQAQAQINSRDAGIDQAYASLEQAEADVEEAQLNLEYTDIRSPVDGVVISREVDVGQTVSASTSAPTLFIIANDMSKMQVQARIDEADIGVLGQQNEVTFRVGAFPNEEFTGRIEEIRLSPSASNNVVTYGVVVTFQNPDMKLKPGMTADLKILVDRRDDALIIPEDALEYSPPNAETLLAQASSESTPDATADITTNIPPPDTGRGFNPADGGRSDFGNRGGGVPPEFAGRGGGRGTGRGGGRGGDFAGRGGDFAGRGGSADTGGGTATAPQGRASTIVAPASGSVYMPGQEWGDGMKIQFQAAPPDPPERGRVWVMTENGPEPREIMVGLTDGEFFEVVSGSLQEGELVLTGDTREGSGGSSSGFSRNERQLMEMLNGGRSNNRGRSNSNWR